MRKLGPGLNAERSRSREWRAVAVEVIIIHTPFCPYTYDRYDVLLDL
jgi:hypothetical protein